MGAKNSEWYNKLVLGSMDKHIIYGDLAHKYVDASVYTAVIDTENDCMVLVKGIYKATGTPNYKEIAATSEEVYHDYISGSMLIFNATSNDPFFIRPVGVKFDLSKVSDSGASPITILGIFGAKHVGSPGAGALGEYDIGVLECKTKEHYTAA